MKWRKLHLLVYIKRQASRQIRGWRKKKGIASCLQILYLVDHVDQKAQAELKACSYLSWLLLIIYFHDDDGAASVKILHEKSSFAPRILHNQNQHGNHADALLKSLKS